MKWLLTIVYGHLIIATGLLRGIEARAYKPNALWFCTVMGVLAITSGFLYRLKRTRAGAVLALVVCGVVLSFYSYCFVSQPEKDASFRVGAIILASVAQVVVILLPAEPLGHSVDSSQ